ncbi:Uncharacterized protein APZ42_025362 [Daphnia magna]|uniref:RNA-directed DNA polymerase n=1 Tax=Daphnia magna TaxID=35525 RepID=A0A164T667_9CRUS|nr:Uncharacterized protein APZ42_025362 [Daphnia magna]
MVNGQRTPPLGRVELTITIGTTIVQAKVLVLEMRAINLLLGNDVLRRFKKLEIEYGKGKPKIRFSHLPVRMAIEDQTPTPAAKIVAKSGERIPARSMAAVEIEQTEAKKPTLDGRPWMIQPATNRKPGPTPGRDLMPGDRRTVVMMTNLENRTAYIHKKMTQRPASWKEQAIHRELTLDMLKKGVIEEATGLWSARTLLIQKKDGSWRFCLDFRPLKNVTIFSVYPMPSIDGALTRLHGAKIFSVMDLESGRHKRTHSTTQTSPCRTTQSKSETQTREMSFRGISNHSTSHKINADGISPDPGKVRAMQNFPTPPTTASRLEKVKFIKSFLGLFSYYRRHIPGFAEAAKPLLDLTREKSLFIWTPTHQERFNKLKQMLADSATLAYPDPTAEFDIHPDACGYGVGAVLLQKQDSAERPLAFASRLIIVTDHHALCWLQSKTELAGRLARWAMTISEYKYVIAHKDGKLHQDADALLHYPVSEHDETLDHTWAGHVNTVGKRRKREGNGQLYDRKYLLYRMRRTGEEETAVELRLCIPKDQKTTILQACYDDVTSGHLGEKRTHDRVTQRYYWHGITRDIENYIKACADCQSRKKGKYRKPPGFLELTQVEKPWDRVEMDILGPFPTSSLGNRYIIVAVDYVTKWAEAVAQPVAGAEQVAEFFVKEILLRHGAPRKLTTDQGKCFVATMMQRVLAAMETNHQTTTAYHPQANGLVERLNHTLADKLSMYVSRDHKDWDATLPFVRFAYNTSRQETTGKSPFFLMHGRHPVLPLDTIFGATPDPHQLVPVEAGGPDKYEIWMLRNLQRVFAEVDDRSQRAQRKYKQHYDTHHREGEKFHPTQQVLVYRLTRKVGLAEKLLHRWNGPKNTEVVHVERLKSFVDLTQPAPNTEGGEQSTDRGGSEGTTNKMSKVEGLAHPRKQLTEKRVRFTTPPKEPQQPTAEADEPVTREETDQNRRYPLRIRKKRFALATTLLYSMVLSLTAHTPPAETRAQVITKTPATWWSMALLLAATRQTPIDGALEVKLSSHGVIFQSMGERFFSDSEWVVVTDVSFNQGEKVANELKMWLIEKTKLPVLGSSSNKDFQSMLPSAKTNDQPSKTQTQDILSYNPSNAEKAQQQLTTIVRDRAVYELTRLETIERNYQGLKTSIRQSRNKRGLVNGGGKILNWLFGVSTTEDLDKVNNQVAKLPTETTAIVHALETHTTLINESMWELQASKEAADALQRSCLTLDKELNNAKSIFLSVGNCPKRPETARPIFNNRPNSPDTARNCPPIPLRDVQNRPMPPDFVRLYLNIVPYVPHGVITNI